MKTLRVLAVVSFVAGLGLLVAGFVASTGGEAKKPTHDVGDFNQESSPTPTATPFPTDVPTPVPTATPTPFDGTLARMTIPKLGVNAPIEDIGFLGNSNQLDTPHDPHDVGWYQLPGYGKPGFGSNALFSGHVDYFPNILGPFNKLSQIVPGDVITVQMQDGPEYQYKVIRTHRYPVDQIPMGDLIWPKDKPESAEWITLITCGGDFVQTQANGAGEYLSRDVVVAERFE